MGNKKTQISGVWCGLILVIMIILALMLLWKGCLDGKAYGAELPTIPAISAREPEEFVSVVVNLDKGTTQGSGIFVEGQHVEFLVSPGIRQIPTIQFLVRYQLTPLGGKSRGEKTVSIGKISGDFECNNLIWKVPWLDAINFELIVKGYNTSGERIFQIEKPLSFIPLALVEATRMINEKGIESFGARADVVDCIYKRLYFLRNSFPEFMILISDGKHHPNGGGPTPCGVFHVIGKWQKRYSSQYHCWMPYCLKFVGKYNIHATLPKFYKLLGQSASHGCVREHLEDAKKIYAANQIGDLVVVVR